MEENKMNIEFDAKTPLNVNAYLSSEVFPVAMPADKDDKGMLTIEDPNLLGIKFGLCVLVGTFDDVGVMVGYISKEAPDMLGIKLIELVQAAERNIHSKIEIELFSDMPEMQRLIRLAKKLQQAGEIPEDKDPELPMCAITCGKGPAGGALLDPHLPELIKEKLNTDCFYIMPSSVQELIAVPAYYVKAPEDIKHITDIVAQVNQGLVIPNDEEDFLSNNVYFFDGVKFSTIINFST